MYAREESEGKGGDRFSAHLYGTVIIHVMHRHAFLKRHLCLVIIIVFLLTVVRGFRFCTNINPAALFCE